MPRPRRSTRDEWIDTFAQWDSAAQEAALDLAECVHRQTKRAESRRKPATSPAEHNGQQSLSGLPEAQE